MPWHGSCYVCCTCSWTVRLSCDQTTIGARLIDDRWLLAEARSQNSCKGQSRRLQLRATEHGPPPGSHGKYAKGELSAVAALEARAPTAMRDGDGPLPRDASDMSTRAQVVVRSTPDDDNITIAVTVGGVARYLNRYARSRKCLNGRRPMATQNRRDTNTQQLIGPAPAGPKRKLWTSRCSAST